MENRNAFYFGDNLKIMRSLPASSVDLIYLDPPFKSDKDYTAIFRTQSGNRPAAQIKAFKDTWEWNQHTIAAFQEATTTLPGEVAAVLQGFHTMIGPSRLLAYLTMMAPRLVEMKRLLRDTGTIYLHCDPTAGAHLRLLMDAVFGPTNFLNEIVWHYQTSSGAPKKWLHRNHDVILRYAATDPKKVTWNHPKVPWPQKTLDKWQKDDQGRIYRVQKKYNKRYYIDPDGKLDDDVWDITLASRDSERLGYPTQKPEELLRKIILASSEPGDVVMDPFMGGGTTAVAAEELGRPWIGIDITYVAVSLTRRRLAKKFPNRQVVTQVHGSPTTVEEASALAHLDRHQFELWACDVVDAAPNQKKGADRGIDGRIVFYENNHEVEPRMAIVSVKSGHVGVKDIRELKAVVEAEGAAMGVFLTLERPTQPMLNAAAEAGTWGEDLLGATPRIQILTVEELLSDKGVRFPTQARNITFRDAIEAEEARKMVEKRRQGRPDRSAQPSLDLEVPSQAVPPAGPDAEG